MSYQGLIDKYRDFLEVTDKTPALTLLEGNTPLIKAVNLSSKYSVEIYLKYEGLNPTGSFKDRGMVFAVAKAIEEGSDHIICASTGNTSAAAAAYAARAGIKCSVIIPSGKIAYGKLAQALIYGAKVIAVDGNFDDALEIVKSLSSHYPITLVNSINPYRLQGQKTSSFEIVDVLGDSPDYLCLPVGNAGNITAYWMGFKEYMIHEKCSFLPAVFGFQAEGASPIVKGHIIKNPETIATAIRIGNPVNWDNALKAAYESDGDITAITDEDIIKAYKLLASSEGVFAEPASCISLAGAIKKIENGQIKKHSRVVCVLTGNGLKDPDTAIDNIEKVISITCDEKMIKEMIFHE
ncbi:MAG: threonine synthase [Clostridia bacterium]|nr:threonine synthase [Clostridia bacterium]